MNKTLQLDSWKVDSTTSEPVRRFGLGTSRARPRGVACNDFTSFEIAQKSTAEIAEHERKEMFSATIRQMSDSERPVFYYLFPEGKDFTILRLMDMEASALWDKSKRWVDMPKKTQAEAEALRRVYIEEKSS